MLQLIFFVVLAGVFLLAYIFFNKKGQVLAKKDRQTDTLVSVFESDLKPIFAKPVRLYVPDTGINAEVQGVGTLLDGVLETPRDWKLLGWYEDGQLIGQFGNVIINGHYDDNQGLPAAFWELKSLKTGDKVYIVDELGRTNIYTVSEVFYLDINDPNRLGIFEVDKTKRILTLVTCGGVWDPYSENYNKRLIVKGVFTEAGR